MDIREQCKMTFTNAMGWTTYWTFEGGKWIAKDDQGSLVPIEISTLLGI